MKIRVQINDKLSTLYSYHISHGTFSPFRYVGSCFGTGNNLAFYNNSCVTFDDGYRSSCVSNMNVSGNAIYNEQGAMKACSTTLAKWVAEGNDKGTTIAKWPSDDALLKMGLDTIAAYKPMPPAPPAPGSGTYSLVDGVNFCYETSYTDANYATKGWKSGKCPNTFNTIVSTSHETICKGHSEENIKYCPKSKVTILVTKKGVGAALRAQVA